MIGFSPWGVIWNHKSLTVAENTINYGYISRQPIKYSFDDAIPDGDNSSHLEENHSHFILVGQDILPAGFVILLTLEAAGG